MTDPAPAILAAILVLTAGLAGCLSEAPADAPADASDDADDLLSADEVTRAELSKERITLAPSDGQWAATRFDASQLLGDRSEANLTISTEPGAGAKPYVGILILASFQNQSLPFSAWFAMPEEADSETIGIESSGDLPASVGIALVVGSNGGDTTFHLGLTEGEASREPVGQNRSEALGILADRPELGVAPDATGEGGAAGTAMLETTSEGVEVVEHGNLELSYEDDGLPLADVQGSLSVAGAGEIPGSGIGGLLVGATGDAGAGEWSLDADLPPATWDAGGLDVDPDDATGLVPHTVRDLLGVETSIAYGSLELEPGEASLAFDRNWTGVGRMAVVTWGWATLDVGEVYGWDWPDAAP